MPLKKTIAFTTFIIILCLMQWQCPDNPVNDTNLPDTTSHNFTWEVDTIGIPGSYLNDVWAVNENDIWVVGNIVIPDPDSSFNGTGRKEYNAAHWNGEEWELIGIDSNTLDLYSIWYFNDNDIWVTDYCSPIHWDGKKWTYYHIQNMGLDACAGNAIWGTSSSNMYFVGLGGSIVHYDGTNFEKMESHTEVDLLDIWGTSENDIWVAGKEYNESLILHYDGSGWKKFYESDITTDVRTLPEDEILLELVSIWRAPEIDTLIAVGAWGIYHASISNQGYARWGYPRRWDIPEGVAMGYPLLVRGRAYNDIFVVGKRNSILHFNGKTWHNYLEFYDPLYGTWLMGISFTENVAYFVGDNNILMKAIKTE